MPKLKIKNGVKAGKTLTLPEGPATLGRGPQNNFIIADDSISTQHLLIVSGRNLCRIKDRGSSNGTFVNGEPVTNADLKQGDVLRCGDIEMVVDMEVVEGQYRVARHLRSANRSRDSVRSACRVRENRTPRRRHRSRRSSPAWITRISNRRPRRGR